MPTKIGVSWKADNSPCIFDSYREAREHEKQIIDTSICLFKDRREKLSKIWSGQSDTPQRIIRLAGLTEFLLISKQLELQSKP